MATFKLKDIQPIGNTILKENGSILQSCVIILEIEGIKTFGKTVSDVIDFEIDNSVFSNQPEPIKVIWEHIKNVLAPQFIWDTYGDI